MIDRPAISMDTLGEVVGDVSMALFRRIEKHGRSAFASKHEALGVITEEFVELVIAARERDIRAFHDETYDVLVACLWALASARTLTESV